MAVGEVVVTIGTGFLEGPVWRPASGDLIITAVMVGQLHRVDVAAGTAEPFARTEGGPNGAWPCLDGGVLVTQNGGLDWAGMGFAAPPGASAPTTPGLQRIGPDGSVALLTGDHGPFRAPNDLFVDGGGTVWFTDPPQFPPPPEPSGRVWRWSPGGRPEVVADGLTYCNGIVLDADGVVVVVEGLGGAGLLQLGTDGGDRRWLVEHLPQGGDGMAYDLDGNLHVCGGRSVTVVSPSGEVVDQLDAPDGPATMTNCCFGGPDLRTLFATDGGSSRVLAFPGRPVPGRPLPPAPW